jgi:hypothetical protein
MTKRISKSTLLKLRNLYFATWHVQWPHEDAYLSQIWLESRGAFPLTNATPAFPYCLELMRECHEFTSLLGKEPVQ